MLKDGFMAKAIWADKEACSCCSLTKCDIVEFVTNVSETNAPSIFGHFVYNSVPLLSFFKNRR
jgi:hypothetical protein